MQRGGVPLPPLKHLPAIFSQPRDAPVPHLGVGKVVRNGGGRNDLFRYVAKISHHFFANTEFYKYEYQ